MAGQSIGDRIVAAQHTIIGSDMSKSICKATTSEVMGPKKKHLDYLNSLTHESNVDIPEFADLLIERSKQPKWVTVFKTLITTHHLMCYGNERFLQHLASRNSLFQMSQFLDRTGVQGYDMSTYIRRYSKYINEKAVSYRIVAYDFTRAKRGKDEGVVRSLDSDQLLKTLPIIQKQLDTLLDFDASSNELMNGVINAAFMLIFKDLIRLFACYNDGIINLLEKYFEMKKNQCKDALELYKKFLTRMNKVSELLKVAEQVGIDKGDIPDLTKAPNSLLNALEQHLASLEGKKIYSRSVKDSPDRLEELGSIQAENKDQLGVLKEEEKRLQAFKQQYQQELNEKQNLSTFQDEPFFKKEIETSTDNIFSDFTPLSTTPDTVENLSTNNILPSNSVQMSNLSFPSRSGMHAASSHHFPMSNNNAQLPNYAKFETSVNAVPHISANELREKQQFSQMPQVILSGNSFAQSFPTQAVNPISQYGILPQHQMGTNFLTTSMQQQTMSSYQTPRQTTQTTSFNPNNPFGPMI